MGGIYLIQGNEDLVEMTERSYDSEALLQEWLARYPGLLAGDPVDGTAPRRWLLISREAGLPSEEAGAGRWSVDHLFLDQDAIPTLVEVKRSSDTRIRREVVGQMLDYAANAVVYWPAETLRSKFQRSCELRGLDPDATFLAFLAGETDPEEFWQKVKTHLQAGRVRMVFVADEIPSELRRVVEFLNTQMDPAEVLAVEVRQYAGQGLTALVPRFVGQTAEAQQRKSGLAGGKRQWDEVSFFPEIEGRNGPEVRDIAYGILKWAQANKLRIWWGKGSQSGSFVPVYSHNGMEYQLFAVYTYGTVEIYFQWLKNKPPFDSEPKRLELLDRLNAIPGVGLPEDSISRRPSVGLEKLGDGASLRLFSDTLDWVIQEIDSC